MFRSRSLRPGVRLRRQQDARRRSSHPLIVEPLEPRQLLTIDVQLIDIVAGGGGSIPENLVGLGSALFFTADAGGVGRELWKSDGTPTGTVLVKDINTGT